MSAAEPAGDAVGPAAAAVIQLNRKRRPLRGGRDRDTVVATLPAAPAGPEQQLAETIEAYYARADGRTLTDDETAAVYLIALDAVTDIVDGVLAQNLLSAEAHRHLRAHLDGMKDAPRLLS